MRCFKKESTHFIVLSETQSIQTYSFPNKHIVEINIQKKRSLWIYPSHHPLFDHPWLYIFKILGSIQRIFREFFYQVTPQILNMLQTSWHHQIIFHCCCRSNDIERVRWKFFQFVSCVNNIQCPSNDFTLVYLTLSIDGLANCKHCRTNINFISNLLTNEVHLSLFYLFHVPTRSTRSHTVMVI